MRDKIASILLQWIYKRANQPNLTTEAKYATARSSVAKEVLEIICEELQPYQLQSFGKKTARNIPVYRCYLRPFCRQPLCTSGRPRQWRNFWSWWCSSVGRTTRWTRVACSRTSNDTYSVERSFNFHSNFEF